MQNLNKDARILVIGSGVGGSTLAHDLFKNGWDVLILEEADTKVFFEPEDTIASELSSKWRNGGITAAFGKPIVPYGEGKSLGGGSAINTAIWQKPSEIVIEKWSSHWKIDNFDVDKFGSYFDKASSLLKPSPVKKLGPDSSPLTQGCEKLGWSYEHLPIAAVQLQLNEGSTYKRQSVFDKLIKPNLGKHLKVQTNTKVLKIIIKNNTVIGADVRYQEGCKSKDYFISTKYIFVAAGAIQTPALLLKSGLSKNVGRTFSMHPTIRAACHFDSIINSHPSWVPACAVTEFMPEMRFGGSVFNPAFFAMSIAEDWDQRSWMLEHTEECGVFYVMVKPESIGTVSLNPIDKSPIVKFQLNSNDLARLLQGTNRLKDLMFAGGAKFIYPSVRKFNGWSSDNCREDLKAENFNKFANPMTIHLFSSCPIGENLEKCAVASDGQVHGTTNLFVCDSSLLPSAPGVNPQASIMTVALKIADEFHENNR
jgi:choline dehydrogenase-like flavoprotein